MTAPSIRPLTTDAVLHVARLWHESWHDGHGAILPEDVVRERTVEAFLSRLDGLANDSFVAVHEGTIAGFGALFENEIDQFYVARSFRGTGLAKLFLSVLEGELMGRGVEDARIQCAAGNVRAYAFYARCGWTDTGVEDLPMWTPDGRTETHPTHLFTKRLGS